jgi:hypothetical protein
LAKTTTVTSRFSRAIVQRAWTVYIAAPSPFRLSTLRSGAATAAPTASGRPMPIAPPVRASTSCGRAVAVPAATPAPEVTASSQMIAPSGMWRAIEAPAA